jgi:hypothetical protein
MPVELQASLVGGFDVAAASITTEASITATTSATGNTCISTGAFAVSNPGNYYVEVWTPYLTIGTTNLDVELFDGATAAAGTFLSTLTGHMTASSVRGQGISLLAYVNLSAGVHTMTVTAFVDGGTGKFGAGNGATGNAPPARIRVYSA